MRHSQVKRKHNILNTGQVLLQELFRSLMWEKISELSLSSEGNKRVMPPSNCQTTLSGFESDNLRVLCFLRFFSTFQLG